MPGKFTKKVFSKTKPFWYSPSLQRSFLQKPPLPGVNDLTYWDSTLEFRVYNELCKYFRPDLIERQKKVTLIPSKSPFREWSWHCDFYIDSKKLLRPLFIEVKGGWIKHDSGHEREFVHMLQTLQFMQPKVWNSLILVSDTSWKLSATDINPLLLQSLSSKIQSLWKI